MPVLITSWDTGVPPVLGGSHRFWVLKCLHRTNGHLFYQQVSFSQLNYVGYIEGVFFLVFSHFLYAILPAWEDRNALS